MCRSRSCGYKFEFDITHTVRCVIMEIHVPYGRSDPGHTPDQFSVDLIKVPNTAPAADPLGRVHTCIGEFAGGISLG